MLFRFNNVNFIQIHQVITGNIAGYQIAAKPKTKCYVYHGDVIKWKHFPRYWPFVRGIHRSPVNSPHKGQWSGALMFSLIFVLIYVWVNNREAGDLRRYCAHYDVTVMMIRWMLSICVLWCFAVFWYRLTLPIHFIFISKFTICDLVTSYGEIYLGQHWHLPQCIENA